MQAHPWYGPGMDMMHFVVTLHFHANISLCVSLKEETKFGPTLGC